MRTLENFVNGRPVSGTGDRSGDVFNPATGEVIANVPFATGDEVAITVEAAQNAFREWSTVPPLSRSRVLFAFKELLESRREELAGLIREDATCWAVVDVEPEEIDRINVYQASLAAMRRALLQLIPSPDHVLVDAREIPDLPFPQEKWIKGDARCYAIAAASILAKTSRDALMRRYDDQFPGYGFSAHKGYPTVAHRDAIRRLGPSPIHRRSFALLPQPTLFD